MFLEVAWVGEILASLDLPQGVVVLKESQPLVNTCVHTTGRARKSEDGTEGRIVSVAKKAKVQTSKTEIEGVFTA